MSGFDPAAYGRDIADIYSQLYPVNADVATAAALLKSASAGAPVLELAIGTGRMAFPLRDAGLDVHGIDISPEMIKHLSERDPAGTITVHEADMSGFDLGCDFGAIVCFSDGIFAIPTQDGQIRCLESCARHLKPGGLLFLETSWPGMMGKDVNGLPAGVNHGVDNSLMITTAYHKRVSQISLYVHSVIGDGRVRHINEVFRSIWPSELDLMARLAGMTLKDRWQDWEGAALTESPTRIISVYERTVA